MRKNLKEEIAGTALEVTEIVKRSQRPDLRERWRKLMGTDTMKEFLDLLTPSERATHVAICHYLIGVAPDDSKRTGQKALWRWLVDPSIPIDPQLRAALTRFFEGDVTVKWRDNKLASRDLQIAAYVISQTDGGINWESAVEDARWRFRKSPGGKKLSRATVTNALKKHRAYARSYPVWVGSHHPLYPAMQPK